MTPAEATQLLDDVKARLDAAKIEYRDESVIDDEINVQITISFPCGRQPRSLYIWDEDDLEAFSEVDFESFTLLGNLAAVAHRKKGRIEAILTAPNEPRSPIRRQGILKRLGIVEKDKIPSTIKLTTDDANFPMIEIGPPSKSAKVLAQTTDQLGISIKITTNAPTNHDDALDLLERISNSVLFSIDLERGAHVALSRRPPSRRRLRPLLNSDDLEYPRNDYDKSPMALYWYARSAEGMPLLQYLAFYQVIEYHYPAYFNAELGRRIRTIIKQPSFRVDRDLDIAKIVATMKSKGQASAGEREQLKATLKECLTTGDIEEFISADSDRAPFFASKAKGIASSLLNSQNRQIDLPMQVAERIYEIRCKIVHTKAEHEDGEFELLLPYSPEAERLGHDIDLVRFVAQKVLISSSRRLEIAA